MNRDKFLKRWSFTNCPVGDRMARDLDRLIESVTTNDNIGLMQETIEDSLHLAYGEYQISDEDYHETLKFVRNGFKSLPESS